VCLVFGSILKFACPVHEPQAVYRKRDSGNYRRDRAALCVLILLVSVVLTGRTIASVCIPVRTIGPTVVELSMCFFVGAYNVLALWGNLEELVFLSATP
jgi:hypothetical protein